jgi:D-alanyl-D-alanine carboxypeptidase (penicillin-binding protein 5/6)
MRFPILFSLLFSLWALPGAAQVTLTSAGAEQVPPPTINAKAYALLDYQSGQLLAASQADMRTEPASLTKLMTAYLTFSALKRGQLQLTQLVPVSARAQQAEGSRMFIDARKTVTVDELIHGMIVQSGNDACIALAELVAGSESAFAQKMNAQAQQLGMANTHFANATGLTDPQHYSTARDLATLAAALVRDFPEYYPLYSLKEYRYNDITQSNRNSLLWSDPTVDGIKTGHTDAAGFCLIASAKRGERRLISVVLGTASEAARALESRKLLNHGFQVYDSVKLYSKSQSLANIEVWKGSTNYVSAGFLEDFYMSLPKGKAGQLKATLESKQPLIAPVRAGQKIGVMKLALAGQPYAEVPVVALDSVPMAGMLGRGWDALRLLFK